MLLPPPVVRTTPALTSQVRRGLSLSPLLSGSSSAEAVGRGKMPRTGLQGLLVPHGAGILGQGLSAGVVGRAPLWGVGWAVQGERGGRSGQGEGETPYGGGLPGLVTLSFVPFRHIHSVTHFIH